MTIPRPSSIWEGNDRDLLQWSIPFYWREESSPRILDATFGQGRFWEGSPLSSAVVGIDLIPKQAGVIQMDNSNMAFRSSVFDVVVYDPPHLPADHVSPGASKIYKENYEAAGAGENVTPLFAPFLSEAWNVLSPGGIVLCKITDLVHSGKAQWQHVSFMQLAAAAGFVVCDVIIKVRKSALISSKWKNAYHARKRHCFWIICRKGKC